jgi:hypothetical protein
MVGAPKGGRNYPIRAGALAGREPGYDPLA